MNQGLSIIPVPSQNSTTANAVGSKQQQIIKQLIVLGLELLLALPFGVVLSRFHVGGVAWIFGGIASGAAVLQTARIFYNYCPKPNRTARKIGMALVGLNVGFAISRGNLADAAFGIPVFVFLTLFLLACGSLIGYIYSRLSKINLLTAMLATVPGGVGPMSAIAADYGRNVTLVSLVQALRVTCVVFLIPLIVRIFHPGGLIYPQARSIKAALLGLYGVDLQLLLLALLLGGLGVYLAVLCKVPAGDFFGALLVGIVFNPLLQWLHFFGDVRFSPPLLVNLLGQMLLGITIGEYWGDKPNLDKKPVTYALMSVVMTLATGAIAAMLAMQITSWDWLTCLLVTAPGGSAEMILVALALNHNVEIVTAGHLVRLIAINSSLPLWLVMFRLLEDRTKEPFSNS